MATKIETIQVEVLEKSKNLNDYEVLEKTKIFCRGVFRGRRFVVGKNRMCNPVAYLELLPDEVKYYESEASEYEIEHGEVYNAIDINVNCGATYYGKAYWDSGDKSIYVGWDYGHCDDYDAAWDHDGFYDDHGEGTVHKWMMAEILMEIGSACESLERTCREDIENAENEKWYKEYVKG